MRVNSTLVSGKRRRLHARRNEWRQDFARSAKLYQNRRTNLFRVIVERIDLPTSIVVGGDADAARALALFEIRKRFSHRVKPASAAWGGGGRSGSSTGAHLLAHRSRARVYQTNRCDEPGRLVPEWNPLVCKPRAAAGSICSTAPRFSGQIRRIFGPALYLQLCADHAEHSVCIRSLLLGPRAYVQLFAQRRPERGTIWLTPRQKLPDINLLKSDHELDSIRILNRPPLAYEPGYSAFVRQTEGPQRRKTRRRKRRGD